MAGAVAEAAMVRRQSLGTSATATAAIDQPFLFARVNLGDLPPGQDSIVGTRRIRAFAFASASLMKRKRLSVAATATATIAAPRLALTVRLSVNAKASAGILSQVLYVRRSLGVDATATATIEPDSLFAYIRLAANLTATATLQPTLYMNTFDVAPIVRTVFVGFRPRTAYPTRIRREVDA